MVSDCIEYLKVQKELTAMQKQCDKPLKANPFTTYRDPATGKWIVIVQSSAQNSENVAA